jgi:D-arginine dehydrogenase
MSTSSGLAGRGPDHGPPADEPSPPRDAQPEEYDIALLVDRLSRATTLQVPRIHARWAGLRSFVGDKTVVAGFDPQRPGFFWLAGQGGYGIQTAPAVSRLAAALLRGEPTPADIADLGVDAAALAPDRPSLAGSAENS